MCCANSVQLPLALRSGGLCPSRQSKGRHACSHRQGYRELHRTRWGYQEAQPRAGQGIRVRQEPVTQRNNPEDVGSFTFQKSIRSKRRNLAAIFRGVEDSGHTLKPAEIANDKQDIANAFDKIIQLESGKIRKAEAH